MSSRVTDRTRYPTINMLAAMRLRIVFHQFQPILLTQIPNFIRIGVSTIQVDNGNSSGSRRNQRFDPVVINFQRMGIRLTKNRNQVVFRNSKDSGDIGIGRNDDLVAIFHDTELLISTEYPDKGIQAVSTADTEVCSYELGIVLLKPLILTPLKIPTTIYHTSNGFIDFLIMKRRNIVQ